MSDNPDEAADRELSTYHSAILDITKTILESHPDLLHLRPHADVVVDYAKEIVNAVLRCEPPQGERSGTPNKLKIKGIP
jgi:hypothetical protein